MGAREQNVPAISAYGAWMQVNLGIQRTTDQWNPVDKHDLLRQRELFHGRKCHHHSTDPLSYTSDSPLLRMTPEYATYHPNHVHVDSTNQEDDWILGSELILDKDYKTHR